MTALIALALKLVGVGFLFVAGIGVIRFSDAFQRMHAATKAGTLGAGLVVLGTVVSHGTTDAILMGTLTVAFLLLTVPVAGHMLGRASYISGANMVELRGKDALKGVLKRQDHSLEERLAFLPPHVTDLGNDLVRPASTREAALSHPRADLSEVKVGIIYDQVKTVFPRALSIAAHNRAHLSAHVLIDEMAIATARDPKATRNAIRRRASRAMDVLKARKTSRSTKLGITYEEGDPREMLASNEQSSALLVVPRLGWFHHGNDDPRPGTSWEPDGLLHLPHCHRGPVLYVGTRAAASGRIIVYERGEDHLPDIVDWSLLSELWNTERVDVIGQMRDERQARFADACARHGVDLTFVPHTPGADGLLPAQYGDAAAIIMGSAPVPPRTMWYGQAWYDRILPGFEGDILIASE